MRVAVVGGTGNIGLSTVEALAADPAVDEVVGIARRPPGHLAIDKVRWASADVVADDVPTLAAALAGADAVVHLAWLIQPTRDDTLLWRANCEGSAKVFDAAARAGAGTIVYSSSVGAYSPGP